MVSPVVGTNKPIKFVRQVSEFGDNSPEEQFVIDQTKDMPEGSYLISTTGSNAILLHELLHALFYVDQDYREKVRAIVAKYPKEAELQFEDLKQMGYADMSLVDELNAYTCGYGEIGCSSLEKELIALSQAAIKDNGIDMNELSRIGSEFFPFYLNDNDTPELFDDLIEEIKEEIKERESYEKIK